MGHDNSKPSSKKKLPERPYQHSYEPRPIVLKLQKAVFIALGSLGLRRLRCTECDGHAGATPVLIGMLAVPFAGTATTPL
jgi:hypothetical protein